MRPPEARRTYKVLAALIAFLVLASAQVGAQPDYPVRPIRLIVSVPAGGGVNVVARIMAEQLRLRLGQPAVVENRGGQAGNLGAEAVANAAPDGYTLMASQPAPLTVNGLLYRHLAYDPAAFVPVAVMTSGPNVLLVRRDFLARSVEELIAEAKRQPGRITYASQGNGTTSHLTGEWFAQATGAKLIHVPYRGTAPALNDLIGSQVDMMFMELASALRLRAAGQARILAVATAARLPVLPDIPTLQDVGVLVVSDTWNAIAAPPKTPPAIVARLNAVINDALAAGGVRARLEAMNLTVVGGTPDQMAELIKSETRRWAEVIRLANVTLN